MSGHSKWSTIKHKKAKTDAARGKVFTKIIKEITTAAKIGGGDPNGNPRLRLAVDKAKEANMPNDNIKRAIDKGVGGGEAAMEELVYEGYAPGGVALMVEVMTDNRNRTAPEVRSIFEKNGGNLGSTGCVSYLFKNKGSIVFDKSGIDEDLLAMTAIDAGAEDIISEESTIEIVTSPENFEKVREQLKGKVIVHHLPRSPWCLPPRSRSRGRRRRRSSSSCSPWRSMMMFRTCTPILTFQTRSLSRNHENNR